MPQPFTQSLPTVRWTLLLLVASSLGMGCDDDESDASSRDSGTRDGSVADSGVSTGPIVVSTLPLRRATRVALDSRIEVTFSEAMDNTTINDTTVVVTTGRPEVRVDGVVTSADRGATFNPSTPWGADQTYTVRIGTGIRAARGEALASSYVWSFSTGDSLPPTPQVNLGAASTFAILAKSGISTVPTSAITGNIAVSPAAASFITGFSLTADATNVFATSPQVTGRIFAADFAAPTPFNLTAAVSDMEMAFTDAAGRAPDVTELGAGNVGGMTLTAQVYKWGTGLLIPTDVSLSGSATDVWIFQIAGDLTVSNGARIGLSGGAVPENIYWQVAGSVDLGTTSHFEGIILGQTSVALRTGASINGQLLAQTAVTLDSNVVVAPSR
jgi:hypothetical protein